MAAPINLPVNAPANIDTPSTGRYNLFLNTSDSDQLYKKDSTGVSTPVVAAGTGTVTSVSVVSANGFTGSVATATTTPAITLATSINSPVLAGNGTALIAATTTGSGSTVVLNTSPTFVTDISAPKIISSTASAGLLLCNNNGVTVASFGVGSAGSTNIALIGATAVTGTISGTSSLTLGTAATTVGSIVLNNATNANTITIQSGVTSSTHTLTLPVANASGVLTNDGAGTLTWAAASSGITIGSTTITGGTDNRILFQDATASDFVTQTANFTMGAVSSGYLDVPSGYAIGGSFIMKQNASSVFIGSGSNRITTTATRITAIGVDALNAVTSALSVSVGIGYKVLEVANNSSFGNVGIGDFTLGLLTSGVGVTGIGYNAGYGSTTATNGTYIGAATIPTGNYSEVIAIGSGAVNTASNQMVIGGEYNATYKTLISNIHLNGVSSTTPTSIVIHACHGSGTNVNAANFTISGGAATGTGNGGFVKSTTSVKRASGTTQQVDTDRNIIPAKYVDITGGAATTFGQLALATSSTVAGGIVIYTIEANDGTDYQSLSGTLRYDVVNKAGTLTVVYSDTQNGTGACSAGTLTATVTAAVSGTNILFQANAVSSLSETVLRVSFQVINNFGQAIVTAA